ncbi:hypothetical protein [Clostridium hydrogenum]|uniref:hypothetical protein n=1 Tax=Clostridium hydrogenum TaxID=2855764 RepID=UPI001F458892|nr:hypothetical protein [Clostridium hydrogenum]
MANLEKVTVNVNAVDLGNIDLLISEGFYSNRTDFIKTAIRNQLGKHDVVVKDIIIRKQFNVGIGYFDKGDLERHVNNNEKMNIKFLGVLVLKDDISEELALKAINSIEVFGVLKCNEKLKKVLISNKIMKSEH